MLENPIGNALHHVRLAEVYALRARVIDDTDIRGKLEAIISSLRLNIQHLDALETQYQLYLVAQD